jgi:hypothetical protein
MAPFDVSWMVGRSIEVSLVEPAQWIFSLGDSSRLSVECPWRLLRNGKIRVSSEDHNQKYGLPAPLDAATEANKLLRDAHIIAASVRHGTSDLIVNCEGEIVLEVMPFSSGYEAWELSTPQGRHLLAGGGGQLSAW